MCRVPALDEMPPFLPFSSAGCVHAWLTYVVHFQMQIAEGFSPAGCVHAWLTHVVSFHMQIAEGFILAGCVHAWLTYVVSFQMQIAESFILDAPFGELKEVQIDESE